MDFKVVILGCLTGFISAFFGIGGSSIDTPLLRTFLDLPPYIALGTPMPLTLLTATIASFAYKREHLVNFRVALYSLIGGVPGMVAGSYLTAYLSGKFLMLFTAGILFFMGIDFFYNNVIEKIFCREKTCFSSPATYFIISVALVIGLLSGILANGGGIFFVPAYVVLFRMKIKEAIATSLLTVAVLSVPGSMIHYYLGHIDPATTAALGIGVAPMAYIGAKLDIKTKSKTIMLLFGILLVSFSVFFFISQLIA
jgi:uncharacterized membrane protein YfcA